MKFYAIGSIIVLVAPLCFGTITGNGDKIEPAFDGGNEYSLIAEPNEDDGLNLTEYAKFKGTVKELNDGEAIVVPCENEVIFQAGDLVAVELPDGCQLTVGEEVTVEYDGDIMEGYPLRVNVVSMVSQWILKYNQMKTSFRMRTFQPEKELQITVILETI